jgi:hypothetical protein
MFGVFVIGYLFMTDHQEFFDAAAIDRAAGKEWKFVGAQPAPEGKVNLPIKSLATGEATILFITE